MQSNVLELGLPGVLLFTPMVHTDARGGFAELFRAPDLRGHGIEQFVQCNYARSSKGVLRGLHLQISPSRLAKTICCLHGRIFDVVADVEPSSATYRKWVSVELDASVLQLLYVPPGFAHGYLVLEDDSGVLYEQTDFYRPELERSVLWNDAELGIRWPIKAPLLSEKDRAAGTLAALRGQVH